MSDERYVKVTQDDRDALVAYGIALPTAKFARATERVISAFDEAEGQRVETIRRCTTHGSDLRPNDVHCWKEHVGSRNVGSGVCVIVEASLILPREASS